MFLTALSDYPEMATVVRAVGRAGLMCYWLALLPSSKTSQLARLVGVPFERAVKYHRLVALLAVASTAVHLVLAVVKYGTAIVFSGDATYFRGVVPLYGSAAMVVFFGMAALAAAPVRRYSYELFQRAHHAYPAGVVLIALHVPYAWPGFIPGLALHLVDAARKAWARSHCVEALEVSVQGDVTELRLPAPDLAYHPGAYYFVCVPAVSPVEWHPISVSEFDEGVSLCFHVRALGAGSWTRRLLDAVQAHVDAGSKSLQCAVDGPHGCLSLSLRDYAKAVVVAGGIGITPLLALLEHIKAHSDLHPALICAELHWAVRDFSTLHYFVPRLYALMKSPSQHDLVQLEKPGPAITFSITVYVTGEGLISADSKHLSDCHRLPNFKLVVGRPDVAAIVANVVPPPEAPEDDGAFDIDMPAAPKPEAPTRRQCCVLVCGPQELNRCTRLEAMRLDIDVHAETFGY